MNDVLVTAAVLILAAAVGEAAIEFLAKPPIKLALPGDEREPVRAYIYSVLSAALGVGMALNWSLGLFALLGHLGKLESMDLVLTGILIGRGSNYIHDFVTRYFTEHRDYDMYRVKA